VRHFRRQFVLCALLNCGAIYAADEFLRITVFAGDVTCSVAGQPVPCELVPVYLSDTLNTPLDRLLVIFLDGPNQTETRGLTLANALHAKGFKNIMFPGLATKPDHEILPVPPANQRLERP
jgi:hypothetical protein